MGKRVLPDGDDEIDAKAQFGERRVKTDGDDVEMGEFEDPWEDELEEEEVIDAEEYVDDNDEDDGVLCSSHNCADSQKWKT